MDSGEVRKVALMSIHPRHATAILQGKKQVEFRKRPISSDVTHVIVYSTSPVAAIIGAFSVRGQKTDNPSNLWLEFSEVGGIEHDEFLSYFKTRDIGTGIRVGEVYLMTESVKLGSAFGIGRPPQSFQYVDTMTAKVVLGRMKLSKREPF